jgi:uncharacterized protein YdhG (YjbR/CyaY superfamily)
MADITVDGYLAAAPQPHRGTLEQLRETLRGLLPGAEETISYNVPAFKINGRAVAGYAFFKRHCSYFPHSGSVLPELSEELSGYEWSKGTLKFAPDKPLPEELVRRLVEVRLAQLGL